MTLMNIRAHRWRRGWQVGPAGRRVRMSQSIERDPRNVSHQFADKGRVARAYETRADVMLA